MAYLELSEKDRKRYGIPERVEFEPGLIGMRTISQLRKQTGYEFETLLNSMEGVPRRDPETNDLALEDDLDAEGNQQHNEDGSVRRRVKLFHDEEAMAALVWVVLWDNGYKHPWESFDVYPAGLRLIFGDEEPGKAETPETTTPES
jgi:hypothetical protein